jgi:hypothetical protein
VDQSPLDQSHELLKAKFLASAQRVSRQANAHSNRTKMLHAALEEEEEKGDDSRLFRLTQRLNGALIKPEDEDEEVKPTPKPKTKTAS